MSVRFTKYTFVVELEDGRDIAIPIDWSFRLRKASRRQLLRVEIEAGGKNLHWPLADEDLHVVDLVYPARIADQYR